MSGDAIKAHLHYSKFFTPFSSLTKNNGSAWEKFWGVNDCRNDTKISPVLGPSENLEGSPSTDKIGTGTRNTSPARIKCVV